MQKTQKPNQHTRKFLAKIKFENFMQQIHQILTHSKFLATITKQILKFHS